MRIERGVWGLAVLIFLFVTSAAHAAPTVNAANDQTMRRSVEAIKGKLPKQKRQSFEEALKTIFAAKMENVNLLKAAAAPDELFAGVRDLVDGKTVEQIIAVAAKLKREQLAEARQKLEELRKKQAEAAAAQTVYADFKVTSSKFYFRGEPGDQQPIVEIAVRNGTKFPVAAVTFKGELATPGRAVPWLTTRFRYEISGGLEPGEKAEWKLEPNPFSDWGKVKWRDDMVLSLEVAELTGADGKPLVAAPFSELDAVRLRELEKQVSGGSTSNN